MLMHISPCLVEGLLANVNACITILVVGPLTNELRHEIFSNVVHVCATSKALDQPAHMLSLIKAFASRLNIL